MWLCLAPASECHCPFLPLDVTVGESTELFSSLVCFERLVPFEESVDPCRVRCDSWKQCVARVSGACSRGEETRRASRTSPRAPAPAAAQVSAISSE